MNKSEGSCMCILRSFYASFQSKRRQMKQSLRGGVGELNQNKVSFNIKCKCTYVYYNILHDLVHIIYMYVYLH